MSVAIASSPVFSRPRIPVTCKTSPESLVLSLFQSSEGSPSPSPSRSPFHPLFPRALRALKKDAANNLDSPPTTPPPLEKGSEGSGLKRKRPIRIDIPMTELVDFSAAAQRHSDGQQEVEEEGEGFSVYCKRGKKRLQIEDRYAAAVDSQTAFFGVFDGHGGAKAAEFAAENLGDRIVEEVMRIEKVDENEIGEGVRIGYLKTDAEFLKGESSGGTCCVTALVRNDYLIVSNAGDCRAVLSSNGAAEALTSDHRPSRPDEKDRIESLSGYVDCCRGVWRLQGSLAVSRGIGDSHLKQWVTAEPENKFLRIKPEFEFLILASDGLWDKVSNQEAVDIARPLCTGTEQPSPLSACKKLAELAGTRGSNDDISVMIIRLNDIIRRR